MQISCRPKTGNTLSKCWKETTRLWSASLLALREIHAEAISKFGRSDGVRDLLLHGIGESSADDAKEKREANDRIEKLEAATRPKPFDERLRMFLNRKDTNILIGLRNGANRFAGSFSQSEPGKLKTLMDEPEAAKFMKVKFDGVATLHSSGIMSGASFELSTELISGR